MNVRKLTVSCVRAITPPVLVQAARRFLFRQSSVFKGPYASWADAVAASDGWDADDIVDKVFRSVSAVRDGVAAFEQDSVLYERVHYSPTILAFLLLSLSLDRTSLDVVDVGGSLGSNYFQNRKLLGSLTGIPVSWRVVEQRRFVDLGRRHFANEQLSFHEDIDECLRDRASRSVIFTGSLQCLPEPFVLLERLFAAGVELIGIDRVLVGAATEHSIRVQVPPRHIYAATFPVWAFSRSRLVSFFRDGGFELVEEFFDGLGQPIEHGGMLFRRSAGMSSPGPTASTTIAVAVPSPAVLPAAEIRSVEASAPG